MKKTLLLVVVAALAMNVNAQFYAGLGLGYGLGADKQVVGSEYGATTEKNIYGSYGQGFNAALKLGYMFSDNLGVELGTSYLIGSTLTRVKTPTLNMEAKSSNLRLAPQLVAKLDNGLYSRFGFIVPVIGKTVIDLKDTDFSGLGVTQEATVEAKGAFSLGFIGAVGYGYALSESMDLFCELEYIGLEIKAKESKITKMEVGGQDQLPGMTTNMIETEFVDDIDYAEAVDPNAPAKSIRTTSPFSSFGLNVGIVMKF